MEYVERILKTSMGEIERLLSTKTVVGEPMDVEGNTIIPLVSFGFAFSAGGGSGKGDKAGKGEGKGEGSGVGTGGGGGIKPVAVIIINKDGVNIAPIVGGTATVFEKISDVVGEVAGKAIEKRGEKKKE